MRFSATIELGGKTATGIAVPDEVLAHLDAGRRPAVVVTVGAYRYRSTVGSMDGRAMIPPHRVVRRDAPRRQKSLSMSTLSGATSPAEGGSRPGESHVSLITLGVDDLARATAFYTAMGWRRSSTSVDGTVTFLHGVPVLALFGREDLAEEAGVPLAAPPAGCALAMNLPSPAAVDRVLARADAAGARISKPAEHATWGGYSGYFLDPDGHLWEIAHNPGFGLADDGAVRLPDA